MRTRCALLALFWLGWLGMLAGAVLIILQAPRCRPPPAVNWWNKGPLYQIGDVQAFADNLPGNASKCCRSMQYTDFYTQSSARYTSSVLQLYSTAKYIWYYISIQQCPIQLLFYFDSSSTQYIYYSIAIMQ